MHSISHYHFEGQQEDEKILQIIRRHWFNIFMQYVPVIFMVILLLAVAVTVAALFPDFFREYSLTIWFFESLLLLTIWIYASLIFVDYYLDVWIITDRRVVNVEQKGLFLRDVSELRYRKIQDVTTEVNGFFPTMLNYGNVYVQTAGERPRFLFRNVPNPYDIKGTLMDLQKKERKSDLGELENMIKNTPEE